MTDFVAVQENNNVIRLHRDIAEAGVQAGRYILADDDWEMVGKPAHLRRAVHTRPTIATLENRVLDAEPAPVKRRGRPPKVRT